MKIEYGRVLFVLRAFLGRGRFYFILLKKKGMYKMKNFTIKTLSLVITIFMLISLVSCDYFIRRDLPDIWQDATYVQDTELGEGAKTFRFIVKVEENAVMFTVHTEADTVGKALLDLGLIEGEDSQWGIYVKKVNGMLADYDVDQTYWSFYINGEYALTGVDSTEITEGETYSFVRESGY